MTTRIIFRKMFCKSYSKKDCKINEVVKLYKNIV